MWPQLPPKGRLHIYVTLPANVGVDTTGEYFIRLCASPQDIQRTLVPGLPDEFPSQRRRLDDGPDDRPVLSPSFQVEEADERSRFGTPDEHRAGVVTAEGFRAAA